MHETLIKNKITRIGNIKTHEVVFLRTKGLEKTVANWKSGQGRAPANYKDGINASQGWQQNAIAAEPLFAAKMQEAISEQRRAKGLAQVSEAEWKNLATDKGAKNIGPGMAAAEPYYRKGMQKNLQVLEGITLPARTADGMQNLVNRAGAVVQALQASKKA